MAFAKSREEANGECHLTRQNFQQLKTAKKIENIVIIAFA
jgi:hypothetical protein